MCHPSRLQFRIALLNWFDSTHRVLPWRCNTRSLHQDLSDPAVKFLMELPREDFMYRIWVSEVCYQRSLQRSRSLASARKQSALLLCLAPLLPGFAVSERAVLADDAAANTSGEGEDLL